MIDDYAFADIPTLQRALERRRVSSLELTDGFLARLERYGERYGAVVTILHERARREAEEADRERAAGTLRGPLHGIPYGIKDLFATPDAPTTWGAEPYRDQRFDFDAAVVRRLRDAGAVLLAKLAMVELAGGFGYNMADASFTGPGRTPWNRAFWSGGSSTGSGAAVAAGLVPFAIGTETCGSIVYPAAFCGVTGLRPTFGRVSRHGAMALCWSLDKIGPLARTARDAETVLHAIAGRDPLDASSIDGPFTKSHRRPRIAVLAGATAKTMPAVRENFDATLRELETFCEIVPDVALPELPYETAVGTIVRAEGASAFRDFIESGRARELRAKNDRIGGYIGYATLAVDYIDALRQRTIMMNEMKQAFEGFDAIATPTLPTVAYPIDTAFEKAYPKYPGSVDLIAPGNLTGWPAIALPNGFGPSSLPTSVSFVAQPFAEAEIVSIARRYQARTTFHKARPTLGE